MKPLNLVAALFSVAGSLSACAHSTPLAPAPLNAPESAQLQAAIIGTCEVTATQKEGSNPKSDSSGLRFFFSPDGRAGYLAANPFGADVKVDYRYHLDGRNVVTDGPYTFRADDFSGPILKLFVYDLSQTYYCTKRS